MNKTKPELLRDKCRAYGRCLKVAPEVYSLDGETKVSLIQGGEAPDELLLKSAKGCPYRAIRIVDIATGEQIFPVVKPEIQEVS